MALVLILIVIVIGCVAVTIDWNKVFSGQIDKGTTQALKVAERALYEIGFNTTDLYAKGRADKAMSDINRLTGQKELE